MPESGTRCSQLGTPFPRCCYYHRNFFVQRKGTSGFESSIHPESMKGPMHELHLIVRQGLKLMHGHALTPHHSSSSSTMGLDLSSLRFRFEKPVRSLRLHPRCSQASISTWSSERSRLPGPFPVRIQDRCHTSPPLPIDSLACLAPPHRR